MAVRCLYILGETAEITPGDFIDHSSGHVSIWTYIRDGQAQLADEITFQGDRNRIQLILNTLQALLDRANAERAKKAALEDARCGTSCAQQAQEAMQMADARG